MPYILNGQQASITEEPAEQNGVTYVPFRSVVTGLGGTINWDEASQQASGTIGQWTAVVQPNATSATVNGTTVQFTAAAIQDNNELYVPADFFSSAYGYKVSVNGDTVTIGLT